MPRVGEPSSRDRVIEAALAAIEEFEEPTAWRRSQRGNLWREWDEMTVTIFQRKGRYCWCINDGEETRFSRKGYETEDDAKIALGEAIGVGEC
jgi:hypothetical protein